jgi:dihydroorotate dehydrogenase (NAD+) catalytic subunit
MTATAASSRIAVRAAGLDFQNPVILASGTAAYGRELGEVVPLEALGGLVTKAVSVEPRHGNRAPRVAEFAGGMLNAIGLANPGVDRVRAEELPWLAANVRRARVLVNVVGHTLDDFVRVVEMLDAVEGKQGFELNVSCPNVKAGGLEFGADPASLRDLVSRTRAVTRLPLFVKLSPTLPDIAASARVALDAGADALTLVNTIPGMLIDVERRAPAIGFGTGGVSGPALLPIGVLATWKVFSATNATIVGVGGVSKAEDALQYVLAGATCVGVGTAALRDPSVPVKLIRGLESWCDQHGVTLTELRGSLEWSR